MSANRRPLLARRTPLLSGSGANALRKLQANMLKANPSSKHGLRTQAAEHKALQEYKHEQASTGKQEAPALSCSGRVSCHTVLATLSLEEVARFYLHPLPWDVPATPAQRTSQPLPS